MITTSQQVELPLGLSLPRDTVQINARCTMRRQGDLRLVSVAGLPMHHWAKGDRIAEAHAMVSLRRLLQHEFDAVLTGHTLRSSQPEGFWMRDGRGHVVRTLEAILAKQEDMK